MGDAVTLQNQPKIKLKLVLPLELRVAGALVDRPPVEFVGIARVAHMMFPQPNLPQSLQ